MALTPKISITLFTFAAQDPGSWQHIIDRATGADEAGIDQLVVSDHVIMGENLDAYANAETGGMAGGRQPTGPDGQWLEPLTVLSHLAAVTTNIRLGTNILLAALRRPVVLAKTLGTLDVLSGGRLDLGVGVGWQREEYEAAGLSFDDRGRSLDHTLEVLEALWTRESAAYDNDGLTFSGIHCNPKPVQDGGLPIWVSGTANRRVARRLVRFGGGWITWGPSMLDAVDGISRIRDLVADEGGDLSTMEVSGNLPVVRTDEGVDLDATMEAVPAMVEAGVTMFRANVPIPDDPLAASDYLTELVTRFRSATGRPAPSP